ncbi:MAG: transcription elongation factor GreB [Deltaproteobacteria bacterium]|nr:transcription elongation factor GreB [Deltaproteobacteria bacterium]
MTDEDDERRPGGAVHITLEGYRRLAAELERLTKVDRPKVVQEVSDAAAQGDRSENAEYIYGKKKLREIDKRLQFLQRRLDKVNVVDPRDHAGKAEVYFGATVTVEDEDGKRATYTIVGEDELGSGGGRISINSPMARALLRKKVDDVATVRRPAGEVDVTIITVKYGA